MGFGELVLKMADSRDVIEVFISKNNENFSDSSSMKEPGNPAGLSVRWIDNQCTAPGCHDIGI
jgi:hypothetical protein